jgi:hypothetical protein
MLTFERDTFFGDLQGRTGIVLEPAARAGLGFLLGQLEADPDFTQFRDAAYVLATIRWETGQTYTPVKEKRARRDRNPQLWKVQNRYWPSGFYGRGYVQITWEKNYRAAGDRLTGTVFTTDAGPMTVRSETFVDDPDLVLEPHIAYSIAARGMREGWFTGKKLSDFVRDGEAPDYVNARQVINRLDQADRIAGYANEFELVLRAAEATPTRSSRPARA